MEHVYKLLGSDEQAKQLWQNREALDLYLARLKELMEDDLMEDDNPKPRINACPACVAKRNGFKSRIAIPHTCGMK